ncbi:GFA family protein [Corallococcus exiguus]|uniref:GFA family protein n=1 Tax=Corallococcus TaxID=83461 RepID=UPI000EA06B05|nr:MULTISPECIES: GFA family protein [Corallococcus]NNC16115.1 GFA family protein [Corallococcus exiguus]NRD53057.1 GFA family protein [Corallococcus exiguus]RKH31025.1 GFA family protein [Corallococcus sp. CA041A]RUO88430.1 GFA family protein [Corallococcus sp. AB018]
MSEAGTLKGSCHCGATRFEVTVHPKDVTRCNCTFCSKRGVLWAYYEPEQVTFTRRENVATYARNEPVAHHHCQQCGCGTWTDTPVWEDNAPVPGRFKVGLNARLFDDFNLDAVRVRFVDGRNLW